MADRPPPWLRPRHASHTLELRDRMPAPARSAAAEAELLAELLIAEFERDLAPLDAPFPVLLRVAVRIARDAQDGGSHVALLHHRGHVARAGGRVLAGERDLRVADEVPHDGCGAAVRRGLVAEALVIAAGLGDQRVSALHDGR